MGIRRERGGNRKRRGQEQEKKGWKQKDMRVGTGREE